MGAALKRPTFSIISSTVLIIEGLDVDSGTERPALFEENLHLLYRVDFNSRRDLDTVQDMAREVLNSWRRDC